MTGAAMPYHGLREVALVTHDMAETVDFYRNILELPLVSGVDLPDGGQHFRFRIGDDRLLGFLWWPDAPGRAPGIGSMHQNFAKHGIKTAHGSMNHLAINVGLDTFERVIAWFDRKRLSYNIVDHGLFMSVYFRDNNNIHLEIAALTRAFNTADLGVAPVDADGRPVAPTETTHAPH